MADFFPHVNYIRFDDSYLFSKKRLATMLACYLLVNILVFGWIGFTFGQTRMEMLEIAIIGVVVVYILVPILKAAIALLGFHLTLKYQLKHFFLSCLIENDFPKTFEEGGNPDTWLMNIKFDKALPIEKRIMSVELALQISQFVTAQKDLPNASKKIFETLVEAIEQYQKGTN